MAVETAPSASAIVRAYTARTPGSRARFERALQLFPNGVTHVGRYLRPYPVYIERAQGSRKWDVDSNEYVDYFGGHGALILGHNHPAVMEAVTAQISRGVHFGASHDLELEWAELIRQMIPSAERVRFTITGTEATHLALRIARAFTGRGKILRFAGHFHGWHDLVSFPAGGAPGIAPGIVEDTLIAPANDFERVRELLESRDDVAAVILEPTGATFGHVPTPPEFLRELRTLTARRGVVLIFDEVISGFRCSPGGAQSLFDVKPDLTALAKIVAGGFPGAALAGRAEILAMLEYRDAEKPIQPPRVMHQGTYNASPVSAAAGIATLKLVRDNDVIDRANRAAAAIRDGMNDVIRRKGVAMCAYGRFSDFHIYTGRASVEDIYGGRVPAAQLKGAMPVELAHKIRAGFLANGVDVIGWPGGLVSGAHDGADVDRTVRAFELLLDALADEGDLT